MTSSNDNPNHYSHECSSFERFDTNSSNSSIDSPSSQSDSFRSEFSSDSDENRSDFDSSSSGSSDEYEPNPEESNRWLNSAVSIRNRFHSAVRRRASSPTLTSYTSDKEDKSPSKYSPRQKGAHYFNDLCSFITKRSTAILIVSAVIWLYVRYQLLISTNDMPTNTDTVASFRNRLNSFELKAMRTTREKEALQALGSGAEKRMDFGKKQYREKKKGLPDKIPNGCSPTSWQTLSFPTCNDIHEVDLKRNLGMNRKGGAQIPADLGEGDKSGHFWSDKDKKVSSEMGFLGSGLWRQVWKVDPRNERGGLSDQSVVLKIMKQEHEVDARNFDRHRRDALSMERLTSSKNVVSIYSYCGNTIMTEYAGITLDDFIQRVEPHTDEEIIGSEDNLNNTSNNTLSIYSSRTAEGRIRLALDVMRGLEAIHEISDGPIIHADIQAKQFLFDPIKGVKLNDFNRCRFVPRNDKSGQRCKIKIQTAPGVNRSPEEYEHDKVDEKIDVYSSANVLFKILTGKGPWDMIGRDQVNKKVMKGIRPDIEEKYRTPGSYDAVLADIIQNAYNARPDKRLSAKQIREKLENILLA